MSEIAQLAALGRVARALEAAGIDYWLFGGWAVDFHAGAVTRPHDDVDLAIWNEDLTRIEALLVAHGWTHAPEPDEDGGTGYEHDAVRLELTYLERAEDGGVYTPLRRGRGRWPDDAFGTDVRELLGTRSRVVGLRALEEGKSSAREDPYDAAKDRADVEVLRGLGG